MDAAADAAAIEAAEARGSTTRAASFWHLKEPIRELLEAIFYQAHCSKARRSRGPCWRRRCSPSRCRRSCSPSGANGGRAGACVAGARRVRDAVAGAAKRAQEIEERTSKKDITVFNILATEPSLELETSSQALQDFFVAQAPARAGRCRRGLRTVAVARLVDGDTKVGREVGKDFAGKLLRSSEQAATAPEQGLLLWSAIGEHRTTSVTAVSMLLRTVISIDLRDNRLTDDEALMIASALPHAVMLSRSTSQAPIGASEVRSLGQSWMCATPAMPSEPLETVYKLAELDLSRTAFCVNDPMLMDEGVVEVGKAIAPCTWSRQSTSRPSTPTPPLGRTFSQIFGTKIVGASQQPIRGLRILNLSSNNLGPGVCDELRNVFDSARTSPTSTCRGTSQRRGGKTRRGVAKGGALRYLDLSGNNLLRVLAAQPDRQEWTNDAIAALCDALHAEAASTLQELLLHDNASAACGASASAARSPFAART